MPDAIRIRVLVADDHSTVRAGIAAMLRGEPDIDVVGDASNGIEAVTLFETLRPDVVLMDLHMPVLDGISAIRAIRTREAEARVIALSTYDRDLAEARSAGACAYVVKDTMAEQLAAAIRLANDARGES